MSKSHILAFTTLLCFCSCDWEKGKNQKLFTLLDSNKTGISFNNALEESHEMNVIEYQDFYSGGGVSIGDIDNDGLSDIFFTGNQVPSKLYKNKGGMVFEDITSKAGLDHMGRGWYTGTSMVDINHDGFLDIYVCKSGMEAPDDRANLLFVNDGTGSFTEQAKAYGIDHKGFAVNAAFFDYDKDGDLDMYLVNQGPVKITSGDAETLRNTPHGEAGDVLFEQADGEFIDVTEKAGLFSSVIGFAHGASVGDVNSDGWDDIFVSNDFFEYDYLYINNGDKTFSENIKNAVKHISYYSMGNDMADFNNDGLPDIVVLDMIAEDNRRLYSNLGGMNERKFQNHLQNGLYYQYMFNVLHMNNGNGTFSDIGTMSGISKTDWSWAPIFADFDNDGFKDLYITNGIRKDIRNIDWGVIYRRYLSLSGGKNLFSEEQWDMLLSTMPYEPVSNYMFRNNGDLTFSQTMAEWGTDQPSWSNGVAFGDLDNDGDLDLVVNNIDREAFVYENNGKNKNFLRLKFKGSEKNPMGLGTKVKIFHGDKMQYQQYFLARGYRSSMEPVMHFGLGEDSVVQKIEVIWPDGNLSEYNNVKANQVLTPAYAESVKTEAKVPHRHEYLFTDVTDSLGININHSENELDDFMREPMLTYKLSTLGPAFAVGDITGNGKDDLFIGGSFRRPGQLYIQQTDGSFISVSEDFFKEERIYEDVDAVFFDADGDQDQDLYVVSGGNENTPENGFLLDRLYLNDGTGKFSRSDMLKDSVNGSGSVVVPFDFDSDGDTDLFVGGRMQAAKYPLPADSYLLVNEKGQFHDATDQLAPELRKLGLVTGAVWVDVDNDEDIDLVIVGEWMPITIFKNDGGKFYKANNREIGLNNSSGMWQTIVTDDFDNDGDADFVVGNLGLNYTFPVSLEKPLEIFADDFDDDNNLDMALGYTREGKLYPVNGRAKAIYQNSNLKNKIPSNDQYAVSVLADIYGKEALEKSYKRKIFTLATSYIENKGGGNFEIRPLDNIAQLSVTNTILVSDADADGNNDLILAGNQYDTEAETIRFDAGNGLYLKGDGRGSFDPVSGVESGLFIPGNVRKGAFFHINEDLILAIINNNDRAQLIKISLQVK